jgi:hypothetical protein
MRRSFLAGCVIAVASLAGPVHADYSFRDYYVAVDRRPDLTGPLVNYSNPNQGRLTLLFTHAYPNVWSNLTYNSNHFHRVGFYNYDVPANSPAYTGANPVPAGLTLNTSFGNARIPEGAYPRISLFPDPDAPSSRFISVDRRQLAGDRSTEYDNLSIASIHEMQPFAGTDTGSQATATSAVNAMYFSSRFNPGNLPRFTLPMNDITVGLQLVSKTPGLNVEDGVGNPILSAPGDVASMGDGNSFLFNPTYWVDASAGLGQNYDILLKLVDTNPAGGIAPESGVFRFEFSTAVPEPTALLGVLAAGAMSMIRRRR